MYSTPQPSSQHHINSVTSKRYTVSITSDSFKFVRQKDNESFIEGESIDKLWILKQWKQEQFLDEATVRQQQQLVQPS
jgi:hypothetical protein